MYEKKGLLYSALDKTGKKTGVSIKASSIYGKPTLAFLEKQFALNVVLRKPFREDLKRNVAHVLQRARTPSEFTMGLANRNINVVFRRNEEGRIYGITYVDHNNKVVFNGSDLGKAFSANAVIASLPEAIDASGPTKATPTPNPRHSDGDHATETTHGRTAQELDRLLTDLFTAHQSDYTSPDAATRKRRKKRRKRSI